MALGLIGRTLGMTHLFSKNGEAIPITVIEAGPCSVVQVKSKEKEGYGALQLGFLPKKIDKIKKPLKGHFKKSGTSGFCFLKEFKVADISAYQPGQEIKLEIFQAGQRDTITATSKGKGFTGVIERWCFR